MNAQEIYKLASELTEQKISNVIAGWYERSETKKIIDFNTLVRLGDSNELACATVMLSESFDKKVVENYRFAYEN